MKKLLIAALLLTACGVDGLIQEAEIKAESGKTADALELLTRAIKQDPQNVSIYVKRASLYKEQGKHAQATEDYEMAARTSEARKNPSAGEYYYLAAESYLLHGSEGVFDLCSDKRTEYIAKSCELGFSKACDKRCAQIEVN